MKRRFQGIQTQQAYPHTYIHPLPPPHMHAHSDTRMHANTYTHTHTRTHTLALTHIHTSVHAQTGALLGRCISYSLDNFRLFLLKIQPPCLNSPYFALENVVRRFLRAGAAESTSARISVPVTTHKTLKIACRKCSHLHFKTWLATTYT